MRCCFCCFVVEEEDLEAMERDELMLLLAWSFAEDDLKWDLEAKERDELLLLLAWSFAEDHLK